MKNFNTQEEFINAIKDVKEPTRSALTGHKFDVLDKAGKLKYSVEVGDLIGLNDYSMAYEAVVDDTHPPKKNMILKEFYPCFRDDGFCGIRDEDDPLIVRYDVDDSDHKQKIRDKHKDFIEAYEKHLRVLSLDPIMAEKTVSPYAIEEYDHTLFALYRMENSMSVDKFYNLDLSRIINILTQTADILSYLHQKDIVYMDLKPQNILYDYNKDEVRLLDFDAAIFLEDIDKIKDFHMPEQRAFMPPELRYITDIANRKDVFISEEIDLYMLGVTFFYLLMDRYPEDLENENMSYLDRNLRSTLLRESNRIFLSSATIEKIISLLKESLAVRRYLSLSEFRDRLREIAEGLDVSKNKVIASMLSAAYIIEAHPLFNYVFKDGDTSYVNIALVGDIRRSRDFFNLLFAAVDLMNVEMRFNIYNYNPKACFRYLTEAMPLLSETTQMSLEGEIIDDYINPTITDKAYAKINFSSKLDDISDHYIIIMHEDGKNYHQLAQDLYEKYKDSQENRIIFNYTKYTNGIEKVESESLTLFNIDLESAASVKSRQYYESILEEAYEIHKFYARAYGGERADDNKIWADFLDNDLYSLKSSIRSNLSMKYRIYISGSYKKDDIARHFYEKVVKPGRETDKLSLRDFFADREHHSWNKFMITQGYRRPTRDEFETYAYVGGKNHIDRAHKLHPLIANTDITKYKNNKDDEFAKVCHRMNEFLLEKTKNIDNKILERISSTLNNTSWFANEHLQEILPLWEELYNITNRVIYEEAFAANTLSVITGIIDQRLENNFLGRDELLADYNLIKQEIGLLLEKEDDKSLRQSDYMVIDVKPLIKNGSVKTVFAPFIYEDELLWANVVAAIKFIPNNLILLVDQKEGVDKKFNRIVSFMKEKRQQKSINVELITYDEMDLYSKEGAIVDLTLNTHTDARREEFKGLPYVEYMGNNKWSGDFTSLDYYINKRTLTIEEAFYLNNAYYYNAASENYITKLNNYYELFFEHYMSMGSDEWAEFNRIFRKAIDSYIFDLSYPECEHPFLLEVGDYIFRRGDQLKYPRLTSFLNDLVREGIVLEYKFPVNPGKLKLKTINNILTVELGDFISDSLKDNFQGFDFKKLYYPLLDNESEKNIYYYAISNRLNFSYKVSHPEANEVARQLNYLMEHIDKDVDDQKDIRVFNHLGNEPYARALDDSTVEFNFELGDISFREFIEKCSALQTYTYFELIRKSTIFDEIKVDVRLKWRAYDDFGPINEGVDNHLDIVCTKEFSTFIITCIQGELKNEDIYEITNNAKQFGIDTVPILINSYDGGIDSTLIRMIDVNGIYLIDRQMIKEDKLVAYLENIAKAKEDWKNLEDR